MHYTPERIRFAVRAPGDRGGGAGHAAQPDREREGARAGLLENDVDRPGGARYVVTGPGGADRREVTPAAARAFIRKAGGFAAEPGSRAVRGRMPGLRRGGAGRGGASRW